MPHTVLPTMGGDPRIAIAFNIDVGAVVSRAWPVSCFAYASRLSALSTSHAPASSHSQGDIDAWADMTSIEHSYQVL